VQSSWIDRDEAMMEEPHRLQRAGPTGVDLVCATGGGEAVQGLERDLLKRKHILR
jgi:hypothetical protein